MYKKYICLFFLCNIIFTVCWFNVEQIADAKSLSEPAFVIEETTEQKSQTSFRIGESQAVTTPRVLEVNVMETARIAVTQDEYEILLRIVEAEAGGEDVDGKLLVANVILNRVESPSFPDTIEGVVFQRENGVSQFSPISDGRYYTVCISDETVEAVNRAINGEDISQGALYFACRRSADPDRMRWFDENLTLLFSHGGHEFFN